ncbi:MAG: hypothetical protein K2P58_01625 [Hyphomonadaceae bacterium]|nr:hypothetical protein [Hyphomonadaceae bacterium]
MSDAAYIVGALMLVAGVVGAWMSANLIKRLVGVAVAHIGAILAAAAVGAPQALLIAGAAIGLATVAVGAAIAVRLQEAHGTVEAGDIDAVDRDADAKEKAT